MLFGFAAAVIVGFLFTAGRNWTGLSTPTGLPLALLALLWLGGRFGMAVDGGPIAGLVDAAFLPAAAFAIARVLWPALCTTARLVVVSPPMNSETPMTPSLPTTAISAEAPSSMT